MREFITFVLLGLAWFGMALTILVLHDEKYDQLKSEIWADEAKRQMVSDFTRRSAGEFPTPYDRPPMVEPIRYESVTDIIRVEGRVLLDTPPIRPAALPPPMTSHIPIPHQTHGAEPSLPISLSGLPQTSQPRPTAYSALNNPSNQGPLGFKLVVDRHAAVSHNMVPEIMSVRLMGIDTAPALIADEWVNNQLRALLADHNFKVICDVALMAEIAHADRYLARCWLPEKTASLESAENWVTTTLAKLPDGHRDLSQILLATGVVVRTPLKSLEDEQDRLVFDPNAQGMTVDQRYQEAERQARQARLGIWRDYRPDLKTQQRL